MMHCSYTDIRDRIAEPPKWWDESAVPRYAGFAPTRCADIYANEVALTEIECQYCGTKFLVCFSSRTSTLPVSHQIENLTLHYGDPPDMECCAAGPTMNSVMIKVVEFWRRNDQTWTWERDSSLERDFVGQKEAA